MPAIKAGGRPARHSRREIVNAILYVVQGGNQWRAMPHDLPLWQAAYTVCHGGHSRGRKRQPPPVRS